MSGKGVHAQVFDPYSQTLLRQLKGHAQPVHAARFGQSKMHVLSGGDDATVGPHVLCSAYFGGTSVCQKCAARFCALLLWGCRPLAQRGGCVGSLLRAMAAPCPSVPLMFFFLNNE